MNFFRKIFRSGNQEDSILTYEDFWNWFQQHEKTFHKVVKGRKNLEKNFFDKMSLALNKIHTDIYYITGMYDDNTAELFFTAEGAVKNFVYVEELVAAAPKLAGWKFIALKPALDNANFSIEMEGVEFNKDKILFYVNNQDKYPDLIDITFVHDDFDEKQKSLYANGTFIFVDNLIGERYFATLIDKISIAGKKEAAKEDLIPIEKLRSFLEWRQKEFIEKYEGVWPGTEQNTYALMEAKLKNGNLVIAAINRDLLNWDAKASHPWICVLEIQFGDETTNNGLPDKEINAEMYEIEDEVSEQLADAQDFIHIGRQTFGGKKEVYWACKEFRTPTKVLHETCKKYNEKTSFKIDFDLYKDKYWQSFDHFIQMISRA